MATVHAKAFRITDTSRELIQCFIKEEIPADTKYVLTSPEGYLFFNEDVGINDQKGMIRFPQFTFLSYYNIQYESE